MLNIVVPTGILPTIPPKSPLAVPVIVDLFTVHPVIFACDIPAIIPPLSFAITLTLFTVIFFTSLAESACPIVPTV